MIGTPERLRDMVDAALVDINFCDEDNSEVAELVTRLVAKEAAARLRQRFVTPGAALDGNADECDIKDSAHKKRATKRRPPNR